MYLPEKNTKDAENVVIDPITNFENRIFSEFHKFRLSVLQNTSLTDHFAYIHQCLWIMKRFPKLIYNFRWRDMFSGSKITTDCIEYEICSVSLRILAYSFNQKQFIESYNITSFILDIINTHNFVKPEMWDLKSSFLISIQKLCISMYTWNKTTLKDNFEIFFQISNTLQKSITDLKQFLKISYDKIKEINEDYLKNILNTAIALQNMSLALGFYKKAKDFYDENDVVSAYNLVERAKNTIYSAKSQIYQKKIIDKDKFDIFLQDLESFYSSLKIQKSFCGNAPTLFDFTNYSIQPNPVNHYEKFLSQKFPDIFLTLLPQDNQDLANENSKGFTSSQDIQHSINEKQTKFCDIFSGVLPLEIKEIVDKNNTWIDSRKQILLTEFVALKDEYQQINNEYSVFLSKDVFNSLFNVYQDYSHRLNSNLDKAFQMHAEINLLFRQIFDKIKFYINNNDPLKSSKALEVCQNLSIIYNQFKGLEKKTKNFQKKTEKKVHKKEVLQKITSTFDYEISNKIALINQNVQAGIFELESEINSISISNINLNNPESYFQKYKSYEQYLKDLKIQTQKYFEKIDELKWKLYDRYENKFKLCILNHNKSFFDNLKSMKNQYEKIIKRLQKYQKNIKIKIKNSKSIEDSISKIIDSFMRNS